MAIEIYPIGAQRSRKWDNGIYRIFEKISEEKGHKGWKYIGRDYDKSPIVPKEQKQQPQKRGRKKKIPKEETFKTKTEISELLVYSRPSPREGYAYFRIDKITEIEKRIC